MVSVIARLRAPAPAQTNQLTAGLLVAVAAVFVVVRLFEDPASPATLLRVVVSLIAVGFVLLARRQSLLRKATNFFTLEALGGVIAFAYVDVPFVVNHQEQIGRLAVAIATQLHQR